MATTAQRPQAPAATPIIDPKAGTKAWMINGFAWLALIAYCWTAWIASGDFTTNTLGRGDEPQWYENVVRGVEVFGLAVTLIILWKFVISSYIRERRLTFDAMFFLGCWLMFFQEPWINWTSTQFMYATTFINFGSWVNHIPGWSSPNGELIPVGVVHGTMYLWLVGIPGYFGSKFMTWLRARKPEIGFFGLIASVFCVFVVFDLILENTVVRLEIFSYAATVKEFTLFAGEHYQFPLYETVSWCATYTALASLHFFRDDQGRSIVERGIDRIQFRSDGLKQFARFACIAGFCQLAILITYNIPYQFWAQHVDPVPQHLIDSKWRNGGVCGPYTAYDCNRPDLPISKRSSPTNRIDLEKARPLEPPD